MAVTLAEAAKLAPTQLQQGVIETFILESVVLDRLPFKQIQGNSFQYNAEQALPGVEFRAVNAAYAESTGTVNPKSEGLVILGGDADVDKFIEQTQGFLNDQRAVQTAMKIKAATYKFQDAFINGDVAVDANSFEGLKKRLTGTQVITAGANGMPVLGANDEARHSFLDKLDEAIGLVGRADAIYTNQMIKQKIISSARRLGFMDKTLDGFGKSIDMYNGVPILDIGTRPDGSYILPQTETVGTSNNASSIYVVRFGQDVEEGGVTGLINGDAANIIKAYDLGELQAKPAYRTRIEFYPGLAVFSGRAAARITGVLNA